MNQATNVLTPQTEEAVRQRDDRPVPLDMTAVNSLTREGAAVASWPTPMAFYRALSHGLSARCAEAGRAAAAGDVAIALEVKIGDIAVDLIRLARLSIDLHNLRRAGGEPAFDSGTSPVLAWLAGGAEGDPAIVARHWPEVSVAEPLSASFRNAGLRAFRGLRMISGRLARDVDLLHANPLLADFAAKSGLRCANIHPRLFRWPGIRGTADGRAEIVAQAMGQAFGTWFRAHADMDAGFTARIIAGATASVWHHVSMALADIAHVRRSLPARWLAPQLLTGTPKYYGRLISWHYRECDREVLRFAHGGERVFFEDRNWSLGEFPYADRYVAHSSEEAKNLGRRMVDGRMLPVTPSTLTFESFGSARHRAMGVAAGVRAGFAARNSTVIYLPSQYLGEAQAPDPGFRVPDPLYFEWQTWLLQTIRSLGFRLVCKVHPRGFAKFNALLRFHADEIIDAPFDEATMPGGCLLFDFAGSAFFDALASRRGVVLIDRGDRPIDEFARPDLVMRCAMVECRSDEANRIRLDPSSLREAISQALDYAGPNEAFLEKYFGR